ncbi:hypothetical protein ACFX11_024899 [Malus domestica]
MADNVFGEPITNATLEGMREYADRRGQIERIDRARVAMNMKNVAGKDVKARTRVEKLKAESGAGIATLCLVYNATGSTLEYVGQKDWIGLMGKSPYPPLIANGQWAAFLHVRDPKIQWGSSAAVVYRGKNAGGINCDWVLSWANPKDRVTWDNRRIESSHNDLSATVASPVGSFGLESSSTDVSMKSLLKCSKMLRVAETKPLRHEELAESHLKMHEMKKDVVAIVRIIDEGKYEDYQRRLEEMQFFP